MENYKQAKMYSLAIQKGKIEYSFIQSFFIYSYMKQKPAEAKRRSPNARASAAAWPNARGNKKERGVRGKRWLDLEKES